MAEIILYGCGDVGKKAWAFFGENVVAYFCDSNSELAGETVCGVEIISLDTLKRIYRDYILIVSTSLNHVSKIEAVLEERGICDYLIYEEIKKDLLDKFSVDRFLERYAIPDNRLQIQVNYYKNKIREMEYQMKYLTQHLDFSNVKPAMGELREKQLREIRFTNDFLNVVSELKIEPFLIADSLAGAIKHNGSIPWDDNALQFGLVREDYVRLVDFCKQENAAKRYEMMQQEDDGEVDIVKINDILQKNQNEQIILEGMNCISVLSGTSCVDCMRIDFWAFDIKEDTNDIWDTNRKTWIESTSLFPLRKHKYEGNDFLVPNSPDSFMQCWANDDMDYMKMLGFNRNAMYLERDLYEHFPTVEFYLVDSFEIYHFLPLYKIFRENKIYAKFVAEPCEYNTSGEWFDYDSAIRILEANGVRYSIEANPDARFAFTTQSSQMLRKYKNKKVQVTYGFDFSASSTVITKRTIEGFDYKCVHGQFIKELLSAQFDVPKLIQIGYPKYMDIDDSTYIEEMDVEIERLNVGHKPILLYFPTWNTISSIQWYAEEINKLRESFFVISKAHHCTYRHKTERKNLETLQRISDIVLAGNFKFESAAKLGTLALCDAVSGAASEVPFANEDIKLVLLYSPVEEKNDYNPIIQEFAVCVQTPSALKDAVFRVNKNDERLSDRKRLVKQIYGLKKKDELTELLHIIQGR